MTTKFKLLAESVNFEYGGEEGQRGMVAFVNDDSGAYESLPALGDGFNFLGTNAATCTLRRIKMAYLERDSTRVKYMLEYSSPKSSGGGGGGAKDVQDRRWSFGGDMQTIMKPVGWNWTAGSALTPPKEIGNIPIPRRTFTINYTRPTILMTAAQNTTFISYLSAVAGKVNSDNFESWGVGNILCTGATGGTVRDEHGNIKYRYDVGFSVRYIPGVDSGQNGWQHLLREDGVWDKPKDSAGNFLYGTAIFGNLFA